MSALEAAFLGLVQGLTEFLPISSSGHLVMFQRLLGLRGTHLVFDVTVHVATLAAIVVWFRHRLIRGFVRREWRYLGKLVVATLPVAVVGGLFAEDVEAAFASPEVVVGTLAATGLALLSLYLRRSPGPGAGEPTWVAALLIGCAQAAALLPGISRSGSTIVAALWLGLAPVAAAEFSFLLGIPAITGAFFYHVGRMQTEASAGQGLELAVGAAVAFVSGLLAIALVFRLLARQGFRRFGFYCLAAAAAFGLWLAAGAG